VEEVSEGFTDLLRGITCLGLLLTVIVVFVLVVRMALWVSS
jgi:hypothetical protein